MTIQTDQCRQTSDYQNMNIINEDEFVDIQKKKRTCSEIPSHAMVKNLQLNKCSEIHDFLKAACSKSIFKHVLFSRGIIPCPVDELLRNSIKIDNENLFGKKETRSEKVNRRKYEKITQQINVMLSDLDDIFRLKDGYEESTERGIEKRSKSGVKAVLITIGPSFSSPKEQYLIRFLHHDWEDLNSRDVSDHSHSFCKNVQERLGQEIGRRSVKELVYGTLEDEFCEMFQMTKYGSCNNSNAKVNVACLVKKSCVESLFRGRENSVVLDANDMPFSSFSIPFMMNRNLEVKEPRMYSKSKGLHRPFFVLDVIPNLKPATACVIDNEGATFVQEETDVWIQFRHTIKGLRL